MKKRVVFLVLGAISVSGCSPLSGLLSGNDGGVIDTYFATNVGRQAGLAEAYAQACPSITFDEAELDMFRVAICQESNLEDDCALPRLEAERTKTLEETLATLSGVEPAQVCADAEALAAENPVIAEYFGAN